MILTRILDYLNLVRTNKWGRREILSLFKVYLRVGKDGKGKKLNDRKPKL
jgi:hypothetical protein